MTTAWTNISITNVLTQTPSSVNYQPQGLESVPAEAVVIQNILPSYSSGEFSSQVLDSQVKAVYEAFVGVLPMRTAMSVVKSLGFVKENCHPLDSVAIENDSATGGPVLGFEDGTTNVSHAVMTSHTLPTSVSSLIPPAMLLDTAPVIAEEITVIKETTVENTVPDTLNSAVSGERVIATVPNSVVVENNALPGEANAVQVEKSTVSPEASTVAAEKSAVSPEAGSVAAEKSTVSPEAGSVAAEKSTVSPEAGTVAAEKSTVSPEAGAVAVETGVIRSDAEIAISDGNVEVVGEKVFANGNSSTLAESVVIPAAVEETVHVSVPEESVVQTEASAVPVQNASDDDVNRVIEELQKRGVAAEVNANVQLQANAQAISAMPVTGEVTAAAVTATEAAANSIRVNLSVELGQLVDEVCSSIEVVKGSSSLENAVRITLHPQILKGSVVNVAMSANELHVSFENTDVAVQTLLVNNLPQIAGRMAEVTNLPVRVQVEEHLFEARRKQKA